MPSTQGGQSIVDGDRIFQVSKTNAANVGDVTLATVSGSVFISSIVCKTVTYHADLTSIEVSGGASGAMVFINVTDGDAANLDAEDKQTAWEGAAEVGNGKTIVADFAGTDVNSVTYLFTIKYRPVTTGARIT